MVKKISLAHLFVLLLMTAFLFLGCPGSSDEEQQQRVEIPTPPRPLPPPSPPTPPTPPVNLLLTGDISISPDVGVVVNDELTATYTGPEIVDYQWKKDSTVIAGETGTKYTPVEAGSFTVTVSAAGYVSKTSAAVTVTDPSLPDFTTAPILTLTSGIDSLGYIWVASVPVADSYDIYYAEGSGLSVGVVKAGTKTTGATSGGNIASLFGTYSVLVVANKAGYNSIDSAVKTETTTIAPGTALFAKSVITGSDVSVFYGLALDGSGNAYAIGAQYKNTPTDFGNGITAQGVSASGNSPLIVKYNSDGVAQWAQSVTAGGDNSQFTAVAVDPSGNVYAVGYQFGTATYTYGGVNVTGTATGYNAVIVKYSPLGAVLWAKTPGGSSNGSYFSGVAADASGAYVVGYQGGTGSYNYNGVSTSGASANSNSVLVKFRTDGTGEWAYSTSTGASSSEFRAMALDSLGNIYAAGYQAGTGPFNYNGASTSGSSSNSNAVLVKYNSSGAGQWARSTSAGSSFSEFYGVAAYSTDVCAVGYQNGTGTLTYSGVSVSGSYSYGNSAVLVKYDSSGVGQWAMCPSTGNNASFFYGVAVDASGVYIAGAQTGNASYTYGTVSVSGSAPGFYNIVLLKLNHSGVAQWARSTLTGGWVNRFHAVAVGASVVWAAGYLQRQSDFTFGNGVSLPSVSIGGTQILLMKYQK